MEISSTAAVLTILACVLIAGFFVDDIPKEYLKRSCMGVAWRKRFPNYSKQDIRQFLAFFTDAFAIKYKFALRFSPDDELLVIYRARYPSRYLPDSLEFETLAMQLEKRYQISFSAIWHEHLTLGELFDTISKRGAYPTGIAA